jgi:acyl carrier protein
VLDILIEQLGVQESQCTLEARIEEDLNADSLDKVEIIMSLDERFGVTVPDETAERVSTLGDLFEMLADLLAKRGGRPIGAAPEDGPETRYAPGQSCNGE